MILMYLQCYANTWKRQNRNLHLLYIIMMISFNILMLLSISPSTRLWFFSGSIFHNSGSDLWLTFFHDRSISMFWYNVFNSISLVNALFTLPSLFTCLSTERLSLKRHFSASVIKWPSLNILGNEVCISFKSAGIRTRWTFNPHCSLVFVGVISINRITCEIMINSIG